MGLKISEKYTFSYIPVGHIYIAPPTTTKDFYKQRRRWFWSVITARDQISEMSHRVYAMYFYMYIVGVTGMISLALFPLTLLFRFSVSEPLAVAWLLNLICFLSYYQFGAMYLGSKKYAAILLILIIPVAFYEGLTILYSLFTRPNFQTFETIKKV